MSKLVIILPYIEEHIENFTSHFEAIVEDDYKLVFIKQKSNRPLNKGKLFNIGYLLHKSNFDYFCFHDPHLIPISSECDYSTEEKPMSLISKMNIMDFGQQEFIDDFNDFILPYDEYFGGAVMFNKKHFNQINGYSNEYWDIGYEDYDLLLRCVSKGLPVRQEIEKEVKKSYVEFDGMRTHLRIDADTPKLKRLTNKSFSVSSWFFVEEAPPYGADVDNNRCEYSIFSRPGFHTGLSYIHGGFLKGVIWTKMSASSDKKPTTIQVPLQSNNWYHVTMSVDDKEQSFSLYVNGIKVGERDYSGDLIQYMNKPYYIGVGDYGSSSWRNFFKGQISEVGIWSEALEDYEVGLIYEKGITKNGEFTISKIPQGFWDFTAGYENFTFDRSGNNNHAYMHQVGIAKKSLKTNNERYLPYRRSGVYGYLSSHESYNDLNNLFKSNKKNILLNRNTFNTKVMNQMNDMDKDGLSSTRFRIVKREKFHERHEIIEVLI
tara:strand:+ start:18009 stop:19475 length:1467 start_codon:yes stop_codon:yes gene_type:complete